MAACQDSFRHSRGQLPGSAVPWLTHMRHAAMETVQQQGLPDTRVEAWKYTDLRALERRQLNPATRTACIMDVTPWLWSDEPMHRLVFVDGMFAPELCPFPTLLTGVTLTSLALALEQCPDELEAALGQTLEQTTPGFNALNTAFLQDGAYIRLERDAVLEQPIHLLFISTGQTDVMTTHRNIIQAGPNCAATVIESWVSLDGAAGLTNTITEIVLDECATLEHYQLVQEGAAATHISGMYVHQAGNSRLSAHNVVLGGRLVRNDLQVKLQGPGAECTLNGLTVTRNRQHVDNNTRIDHHSPQATSNECYRGILDDRSRTVFSGRIVVHPDAQQTRAQQSNHSLLLSADAEADARPQFEIHADDVRCTHGCTVGELDEDALFYLRSRALDETAARNLLVYAFAADVLERMQLDSVRHYLEQQLAEQLSAGTLLQAEPSH